MNGVYGYIIRLISKERKLFVIINLIGNINEYLIFERLLCAKSAVSTFDRTFIIARQSLAIKTIRFAYGTEKLKR